MTQTQATTLILAAVFLSGSSRVTAQPTFYGPTPYLSAADSPFAGTNFTYHYLENFEGGTLSTPGVTASGTWRVFNPSPSTDSVDADDGVIDGSGLAGHSFFSNFANTSLTFTFNAAALGGHLPTHAGVVWTDVGQNTVNDTIGNKPVNFSAKDALGGKLGTIGPFTVGDGVITGTTAEDRFFGVYNPTGISSFTISMPVSDNWEVDHLQYGFVPVPEPASLALVSAAASGTVLIGRRGRAKRRQA